jgi:hypothetical protein
VAIAGGWMVAGGFFATQNYTAAVASGHPGDLAIELSAMLVSMFVSALLTPFLLYAVEKTPVTRTNIVKPALALSVPVVLFGIVHAFFDAWSPAITDGASLDAQDFFRIMAATFHPHILMAASVVAIVHLLRAWRENAARAVRERQVENDLSRAQLQLLQAQMEPHFLFNTLNAATALLATDREGAATTVFTLAELLQSSHDLGGQTSIPVSAEVAFLEAYLSLQKVRFPDRLETRIIVDPAARDVPVPSLILQPLVENAILHGVIERAGGGNVTVSIRREGSDLYMEVRDDGAGATPQQLTSGRGLGLANTRSRLECLYKDDFTLRFHHAPDAFVAAVTIPAVLEGR